MHPYILLKSQILKSSFNAKYVQGYGVIGQERKTSADLKPIYIYDYYVNIANVKDN